MKLTLAAAYWAIDQLPGEKLPGVAQTALSAGLESESLLNLAFETPAPVRELGNLFVLALRENNVQVPERNEAAVYIAKHYAEQIVNTSMQPYEGAKRIVYDVCHQLQNTPPKLFSFIGLEDEYEDFSDSTRLDYYGEEYCKNRRNEIESEIIRAAKSLLDRAEEQSGATDD